MTSVARAIDTRTAPAGPFTVQWEFADAEPWHVRVDNGSTAAGAGPRGARRPRAALPLRGLRRRRRRPPRPAPRAGHGQAAPARLAARAVGRAYALRVTEKRLRKLLAEAGVDLERPRRRRRGDVGVWERSARDTVRARWASRRLAFEVGLSSRGSAARSRSSPRRGCGPSRTARPSSQVPCGSARAARLRRRARADARRAPSRASLGIPRCTGAARTGCGAPEIWRLPNDPQDRRGGAGPVRPGGRPGSRPRRRRRTRSPPSAG